jgi:hypothetical protein
MSSRWVRRKIYYIVIAYTNLILIVLSWCEAIIETTTTAMSEAKEGLEDIR